MLPARLAPVPTTIAACVGRTLRDPIERAHDACMRATEHLSTAMRARPTLREVVSLYAAVMILLGSQHLLVDTLWMSTLPPINVSEPSHLMNCNK